MPTVEQFANDAYGQRRTAARRWFAHFHALFHGEQLHDPQPQQRPVQFHQGVLRCLAARHAATDRLFQRAKLQFDSPAATIKIPNFRQRQRLLVQHVGQQRHGAATHPTTPQTQHQRPLMLLGRLVRPEVHRACFLAYITQATQQGYVRSDADQEAVTGIQDGFPQIVPGETRIRTKQGVFRKLPLQQQVPEVVAFAGMRRTGLPTPGQSQAHMPHQRQPHLRLDRFRARRFFLFFFLRYLAVLPLP